MVGQTGEETHDLSPTTRSPGDLLDTTCQRSCSGSSAMTGLHDATTGPEAPASASRGPNERRHAPETGPAHRDAARGPAP